VLEILVGELKISARPRSSPIGEFLGLARAVRAMGDAAVALELAPDRAAMTAQVPGNLRLTQSLLSQHGQHISLLRGDLAIRHDEGPLLGGGETSSVSSDRLANSGGFVALTM